MKEDKTAEIKHFCLYCEILICWVIIHTCRFSVHSTNHLCNEVWEGESAKEVHSLNPILSSQYFQSFLTLTPFTVNLTAYQRTLYARSLCFKFLALLLLANEKRLSFLLLTRAAKPVTSLFFTNP